MTGISRSMAALGLLLLCGLLTTVSCSKDQVTAVPQPQNLSWRPMVSNTTEDLYEVFAKGAQAFAVGHNETIRELTPAGWTTVTTGQYDCFSGAWISPSNILYVSGWGGFMQSRDAGVWTPRDSGNFLGGLWGTSDSNIYAPSNNGNVIRWDGTQFSSEFVSSPGAVEEVWGADATHVYAVTSSGGVYFSSGDGNWSLVHAPGVGPLSGVHGTSASNVYVTGNVGTVVRYNGTDWQTMTSNTSVYLWDVWAASRTDVFAVGDAGAIIHYDGVAWSPMVSNTAEDLLAVYGSSGSNVFAVGRNGAIVRYAPE